jgi:thioredoxin 1
MENITGEQLETLKSSGQTLLVDYWATWCGPCKTLIPRLEDLESQYPNVKFVKIDVDQNTKHAQEVGIRSVPTVIVINNKEVIHRSSGVNTDAYYKEVLNKL